MRLFQNTKFFFLLSPSLLAFFLYGCFMFAKEPVFIGSSDSPAPFKARPRNAVSPAEAMKLAEPYLARIWQLRCQKLHKGDSFWCKQKTRDLIVEKGEYYYITRTSYPYKTIRAYLRFAVRVHVQKKEISFTKDLAGHVGGL